MPELPLVNRAERNASRQVAAGQFVGFMQHGIGRVDDQALAHDPGAGHAKQGGSEQNPQFQRRFRFR